MFSLPIFLFLSLVLVVHGLPSTFHSRADQVYYVGCGRTGHKEEEG
jgi:hypothetical protein